MYFIRHATEKDLPLLPAIERAAGMLYLNTPYPQLAQAPNVSANIDHTRELVWVIATDQAPVGFVIVRELSEAPHIHEIDVHPAHARRGLGRRLIQHVEEWARARRANAMTLTTFGDVPWNGPYYARLGFEIVAADELSKDLREILRAEAANGIPMQRRIAMRKGLPAPLAAAVREART